LNATPQQEQSDEYGKILGSLWCWISRWCGTRRQLRKGYEDASDALRDTASNVGEQAGKYIKRGKNAISDVVDSAQNIADAASKRVASFR
jgi:hypothetical protein